MTWNNGDELFAEDLNGLYRQWISLHRTASLTVNTSSNTLLSWDGVEARGATVDDADWWTSGAPGKIVIPATGIVDIHLQVLWPANGTNIRTLWLQYAGGSRLWEDPKTPNATTTYIGHNLRWRGPLNAADEIELYAWQNSGSNLSVTATVPVRCTATLYTQ